MESLIVLVIVGAVSVWLAFRVHRFIRGARASGGRVAPDCSAGCLGCTEGESERNSKNCSSCAEFNDAGKALLTKQRKDGK